jgi:hypothetical protein
MSKPPKNLPDRGDRCRLRGRDAAGQLATYDPYSLWAKVIWDDGVLAPIFVHLHELEKITNPLTG